MNSDPLSNPMARQVSSLPELIVDQYHDLEPKVRHLLSTPEIYALRKIYLTGCGDSLAACIASRGAFELLAHLPVEVVPAIELARHLCLPHPGSVPYSPTVIAVSHSGEVARVYEAVKRINHSHGFSIGITSNPSSRLGQEAGKVLKLDVPSFESAPGVRSYLVSLFALLLLAIRLGEVLGHLSMDLANSYRLELLDLSARLQDSLEKMISDMSTVARAWADCSGFDFIGAGPDYASAYYGHAKVFEATGRYAMVVNTEEWLHLNYFVRETERTGTVLVVDKRSNSLSRAIETAGHAVRAGRSLLVLTSTTEPWFPTEASLGYFPETSCAWMSPLVSFVPLALLASYLFRLLGEEYGRGAKGYWSACRNGATTKESRIVVPEEDSPC